MVTPPPGAGGEYQSGDDNSYSLQDEFWVVFDSNRCHSLQQRGDGKMRNAESVICGIFLLNVRLCIINGKLQNAHVRTLTTICVTYYFYFLVCFLYLFVCIQP